MSHGRRVLIVEDSEDSLELYRYCLEQEGFEVHGVGTIRDAIRAARDIVADVLVSDLGLPDGSGLDLVRRLRAEGFRTPAIALTGSAEHRMREEALAAGFSEYCSKPCTPDALRDLIERAISGGLAPETA